MAEEKVNTKVEEKVESKKLDDLKKTSENKAAVAESEGKAVPEAKVEKKSESKPAVAKAGKAKAEPKTEATELVREYIVPMRRGFMNVPHYRRAKKAVKTLKEFMVKHMNIRDNDTRKIKVDITLNNEIWFRGIRNPLHKIKVKAVKKDGIVVVTLKDPSDYVKFKMAREEKKKLAMAAPEKPGKAAKEEKVVDKDKDKDGVDDAKEEKEAAKSEAEKDAKAAKIETNVGKHSAKGETKQKKASTKGLK